jgi:hypothetical protein
MHLPPVRYVRRILIAGALSIAAAWAIYLVRSEPKTTIVFSPTNGPGSSPFQVSVTLTFKDIHPTGNLFTGSVVIDIFPDHGRYEEFAKWAGNGTKVKLRFDHHESDGSLYQGGSDDTIALAFPDAWGALRGAGTFSWAGDPQHGPFLYPFDRYVLRVNPILLQPSDSKSYPFYPIDTLVTDFGNSNFIPRLKNLRAQPPNDLYEITVERPVLLRRLAIIVGGLLLVWLIYLVWVAKPEEYAGHVVTLFVGVFSIRSSLLSGAPVFPSLIDYCALAVYLSAVLIVLIKWMLPDKNKKECPFCKSSIPLTATVCPQCTLTVGVQA